MFLRFYGNKCNSVAAFTRSVVFPLGGLDAPPRGKPKIMGRGAPLKIIKRYYQGPSHEENVNQGAQNAFVE
jgi:hypothetical protein